MRHFGETKHRKVLRKSKKQWITVGLTSAALGITGLVHNAELVSAEEAVADQTEEQVEDTYSLEEFVSTYLGNAQEGVDQADLLAGVSVAAEEKGLDADAAVAAVSAQLDAEVKENQENEDTQVTEEETEEVATQEEAAPQIQTFSAPAPQSTQQNQVTNADLDAYEGADRHADGSQMESRQIEVELDQEHVRSELENKVYDFRTSAYNRNLPFQYEWYDKAHANNSSATTLQQAARDAGYSTAHEYASAINWSDRLEDYSIQRATELLTTGYHSGNRSHQRPDQSTSQHKYIDETGTVNHSAPENIHAAGSQDLDQAFYAWTEREVSNLVNANGRMVYGGQATTTAHIHSILNPVYTGFGGATVELASGERGVNASTAHVLMVTRRDNVNNHGHVATSSPRVGTYHVDVKTKANNSELPGEVDSSQPTQPVVEVIEFETEGRFNPDLLEGQQLYLQKGQNGERVNGIVTVQPVDEIIEFGPVREPIAQGDAVESFNPELPVDAVETTDGQDGYKLVNPLDGTVVREVEARPAHTVYGPSQSTTPFETERRVNFDLELNETRVVQEGQNGIVNTNPLTDQVVEVVQELQNRIVEVGVEQRDVSFDTERRPVVGLEEERVVQEGSTGTAYFDSEGNRYEDRYIAPVNEVVEYPAITRELEFEVKRVANPELEVGQERVTQEGQKGLAYYDEKGNLLDVAENVDPVDQVVEYGVAVEEPEEPKEDNTDVENSSETEAPEAGQDQEDDQSDKGQEPEEDSKDPEDTSEQESVDESDDTDQDQPVVEDEDESDDESEETSADQNQSDDTDQDQPVVKDEEDESEESDDVKSEEETQEPEEISDQDDDKVVAPADSEEPAEESEEASEEEADQVEATKEEVAHTVAGLTNLSKEERRQVVAAIDKAESLDQVKQLEQAAEALHTNRSEEDKDQGEQKGQRLPDTATGAWALGLVGLTSILSGLGIKKIKK